MTSNVSWMPFNGRWKINEIDQKWPNPCRNSFNSIRIRDSYVWISHNSHSLVKAFSAHLSSATFFRLAREFSRFWQNILMAFCFHYALGICSQLLLVEMKLVICYRKLVSIEKKNSIISNNFFLICRVKMATLIKWCSWLYACNWRIHLCAFFVFVSLVREFTLHSMELMLQLIS